MQKQMIEHKCLECGETFFSRNKECNFCSPECRRRRYQKAKAKGLKERTCAYCHKQFTTTHYQQKYCCEKHQIEAQKLAAKTNKKCQLCGKIHHAQNQDVCWKCRAEIKAKKEAEKHMPINYGQMQAQKYIEELKKSGFWKRQQEASYE